MKRVLSLILSAALSLSVFFALPLLPNGELPTDPNIVTIENEDEKGEGEGESNQNPGTYIEPQDGFPDGCPDM